ncbi:MAG: hypothetical protein NC350_06670 [Corallococcus sp.]|nr:hypothetical protein [Corallococcus sp.]
MIELNSNMYKLMRESEFLDDDGMDLEDARHIDKSNSVEKFKREYKDYYSDIKLSVKEDW